MPRKDAALAVTVAVVWGVNFVAAAIAMESLPPLLFAALRFTLVAIPAVFFVRPPGNGWATVVGCGAAMGVGQFGLLYTALAWGMPAGLASLVLQVQTVFTVVIASLWLRERPTAYQLSGIAVGLAGMAIIGAKHVAVAPILPFLMTMGAAAAWALGNVLTRRRPPRDGFSLVVWSALVSPVPLLALSLALEGPERDWAALGQLTPRPLVALAFVTYGASMVGYGLWNLLLSRHAASTVAPWSMLVPPVGSIAAYVYNGEQPGVLGLVGGAVVTVGVLRAGTKRNVIPDEAYVEATVRTFSPEAQARATQVLPRVAHGIAAARGLEVSAEYLTEYPITANTPAEADFSQAVVEEMFGDVQRHHRWVDPIAGSEDFSYVLREVPGSFIGLGAVACLLYTSPSPRDGLLSRMPSSA